MVDRWWRRLLGGGPRVSGVPPSGNGASSFHLRWDTRGPFTEVSVTIEVLEPPTVPRLYFWAVQADFADASGRARGGAHLGLQWHPDHPRSTAVNWGGYDRSGTILTGSRSGLPSALDNDNTRDFAWRPGVAYRLVIGPSPEPAPIEGSVAWRGSVVDLATNTTTVVRDLYVAGDRISGAVMWSEVFARCDDPSVAIRWSDPAVVDLEGEPHRPASMDVNYQSHVDGGCANTDSTLDGVGVLQRTSVERRTRQGDRLAVPNHSSS